MEMVEVNTCELVGPALDWAVAKADKKKIDDSRGKELRIDVVPGLQSPWIPSVNWSQGGPLIEKHGIRLDRSTNGYSWYAGWMFSDAGWNARYEMIDGEGDESGISSPLVAACRAIVTAKLGHEVSVPKELMQ